MPRIILMSGKGGVGKTTVAAATGLATAQRGARTLILSFDLAHSLADAFDLECDLFDQHRGAPWGVAERLDIQEIDVQEDVQRHWGDIYRYLALLFASSGLSEVMAEELAIIPGMEDVITLLYLNQYVHEARYDTIIVDCAPTGESLRFVSMPTTLDWYMRKIFGFERNLMKMARPVARMLTDVPLPDESYFAALQRLFTRLEGIDRLLLDPHITTVRLVTNAEKMVLRETQRAYMYFSLYGLTTDMVIINRLFPPEAGYLARWAATQATHVATIRDYFQPVPVSTLPLFSDEVVGVQRLRDVATALYGTTDPAERLVSAPPYVFTRHETGYRLEIHLPFVQKQAIDMTRQPDELVVRIGSFKRHVSLPRSVARLKTAGAKMEGDRLVIQFVEEVPV